MSERPTSLNCSNLFSLHALLPLSGYVGYLLAFFQSFETLRLDRFEMNEQVGAAILRCNEPKALIIVEPLHGSFFSVTHIVHLYRLEIE